MCPGFKAFELEGLVQTCGVARPQRPSGWRPFTPQRVETKHDETFGSFGRTGHLARAQRPRMRVAVELGSATGRLHGRNAHRAHGSRKGGSSSVGPAVTGSVACTTGLRVHVLCREQLILQGKGSGGLYKGCSPLLTQPASPLPARGGPPAGLLPCLRPPGGALPPAFLTGCLLCPSDPARLGAASAGCLPRRPVPGPAPRSGSASDREMDKGFIQAEKPQVAPGVR